MVAREVTRGFAVLAAGLLAFTCFALCAFGLHAHAGGYSRSETPAPASAAPPSAPSRAHAAAPPAGAPVVVHVPLPGGKTASLSVIPVGSALWGDGHAARGPGPTSGNGSDAAPEQTVCAHNHAPAQSVAGFSLWLGVVAVALGLTPPSPGGWFLPGRVDGAPGHPFRIEPVPRPA